MYYEAEGIECIINDVADDLLSEGIKSSPRGKEIIELLNVNICIRNPMKRLAYFEGRGQGFNLCHAIIESLMLVRKENALKYFSMFNKNIEQFSDDGTTLHGAYGKRIALGIPYVIRKLKEDKDTRQAVLNIYSYNLDSEYTKDVPCTETLQFLIREGKLHMIVNMRSNDIIWGFPYDVFMFTSLQEVIANTLEVELGYYYHNAGSFHVYKEFYETLDNMVKNDSKDIVCNALLDVNYDDFFDMSSRYVGVIDSVREFDSDGAKEGYLRILEKEYEFRKMKDAEKNFNEIYVTNYLWASDFTKRWYR